jgi:hypothetical protein
VGPVAEFVAQAPVEPVRGGFLCVGITDQVTHSESGCRGAHGKRVDGFAPGPNVLNAGKNDLCSGKLVEFLWPHEASLERR